MSNIDRAAELLKPNRDWCDQHHNGEGGDPCMFCEYNAGTAARILADAGLLVPDTDHPATLTTESDFTAAPIGTVVLHPWGAAVKRGEDSWGVTGNDMRRRDDTVGDLDEEEPLTVLRWGPGEAEQ